MRAAVAALCLFASAVPATAEAPVLTLPLDCTLGADCFIEDYVDRNPEPGRQSDYACGFNARDNHKGTDFALLSFDAMAAGVDVLAAAPGTVLRTRDSMADDRTMQGVTSQTACGNAVLLDHGDGWTTIYCHLKRGSVAVQPGQNVQAGDPLGQVGLSGMTNHPHVHIGVRHNGVLVDPFAPGPVICNTPQDGLWADPPPYYDTGLMTAGFSDAVPTMETAVDGTARLNGADPTKPLVVYTIANFLQPGDVLTLSAHSPDGAELFRKPMSFRDPKRSQMQAAGLKAPKGGWPAGDYLGEALLTRDGVVIAHRNAHVTVE